MTTKETKPGQCVTRMEPEDGRFLEIRQEEDRLVIIIGAEGKIKNSNSPYG